MRRERNVSRVVVVGSCNVDVVAYAEEFPRPGETVAGNGVAYNVGGKGANQAVAAARCRASVEMIGAVGDDAQGLAVRDALAGAGVGTSHLRVVQTQTGMAQITVNARGENVIVVVPGANGALRDLLPEDVRVIEKADVLLTQLEVPLEAVAAAISIAAKGGARVLLTPVPVRPLPKHVLDGVDILALSESEARQLTGAKGLNETVLALLETVPEVVVTRGAEGCLYANRQGERLMAPAPRAVALDTTGAGDTLIGVLSTFMSTGTDMRDALRWAVTAASLSVQLKGASSSVPSQDHIQRVLVETPEVTRLVAARVLKREIRHG